MPISLIKFIMFLVWFAALIVAQWAAEVGRMFAKRISNAAARPLADYFPRIAVILPIKGVDDDSLENVRALLHQDYFDYRLLCALESEDDPVRPLLEKLAREDGNNRLEIIIAGLAQERGQKVHNQLAAVAQTTEVDDVLVFVDADAKVNPDWLRALVGPLRFDEVGVTTGYRFYVPAGPHPANAMVSVINAGVAALLGPTRRNMAWGGSMAIKRANFFTFGIHDAWQNALSDDYVMSYCVKNTAKKNIEYVPKCLLASPADFNWRTFFTFACRQYRITRICAPWAWLMAVGGALLYLAALAYTIVFWAISLAIGPPDHLLAVMFLFLYLTAVYRGRCLLAGAKCALPDHAATIDKTRFWYTWGYPCVMFVNLLALLGSAVGRNIVWRGVTYTMRSRTQTQMHRAAARKPVLTGALQNAVAEPE